MSVSRRSLSAALSEWRIVVGEPHVLSDDEVTNRASTATFQTHSRAHAIVRPSSREQVQDCVRVANRFGVPIYPISSGKNWGYGSRVPVEDGALLDLGRMNRIVELDEDLAFATIEPGVTQRQLYEFLRMRGSRLWMDATGASPDCSVVGNTLERGFGHTPLGDHVSNVCGLEVVLPTGDAVNTGFARFGDTVGAVSRWGVGPSLDGLFSQSSFGIVTRMTVWLMPEPERFQAFFFTCRDARGLAPIVDALRPLRLNGTLRSLAHIGNDYKVLAGTSRYPWAASGNETPLGPGEMATIRRRLGIGCWNGSGGLYGTRAQVKEARRQVRAALAGKVDRVQFVDDRALRQLRRFATPFRWVTGWDLRRTIRVLEPVYNLMKGVPTDATLGSVYWRKRGAAPQDADPDRDRCGLLWCSPVVPSTGRDAAAATDLATTMLLAHGFEPQISVSLAGERSLICVITISYDRDVPGEDDRALRCYRLLTEQLIARGYPPYRLNVSSMDVLTRQPEYGELMGRLKDALDPKRILAPGRYESRSPAAVEPEEDEPSLELVQVG